MTISVNSLAMQVRRFLDNDWDYIIAISGDAGVGKSTLTIRLGRLLDKSFSYDRNDIYSSKELKEKLWGLPTKSFINIDEAINVVYRRDFFKREQKNLLKDLDVVRDRNLCYCFLIPNFWDLDSKILNSGRIKVWIYVTERGKGYIFRPDKNPFNPDPWNKKDNFKKLMNWDKGVHPRISRNYLDTIVFDPLELTDFEEYKRVKAVKKKKASQEMDEEESTREKQLMGQRDRLIRWIISEFDVEQKQVASVTGLGTGMISTICSKR